MTICYSANFVLVLVLVVAGVNWQFMALIRHHGNAIISSASFPQITKYWWCLLATHVYRTLYLLHCTYIAALTLFVYVNDPYSIGWRRNVVTFEQRNFSDIRTGESQYITVWSLMWNREISTGTETFLISLHREVEEEYLTRKSCSFFPSTEELPSLLWSKGKTDEEKV